MPPAGPVKTLSNRRSRLLLRVQECCKLTAVVCGQRALRDYGTRVTPLALDALSLQFIPQQHALPELGQNRRHEYWTWGQCPGPEN